MSNCDPVKQYLLKHLMEDVEAHEKGLYSEIDKAERKNDLQFHLCRPFSAVALTAFIFGVTNPMNPRIFMWIEIISRPNSGWSR